LAGTRIINEHVSAVPTATSFNHNGACLPSVDPVQHSPGYSGYIRRALVVLLSLRYDTLLGLSTHNTSPALGAGDIFVSNSIPILQK
jgi:hypothetical protein